VLHQSALHALVRDPRWVSGDLDLALRALIETASTALHTARVAVWFLEEGGIRTTLLYDRRSGAWLDPSFLSLDAAPAYFEALRTNRLVAIDDAQRDPRTASFNEGYLQPLDIGALLDAPILVEGQLVGVVCHEHVGGPRIWSDDHKAFAATIGDLAALAMQTARRRDAEAALARRDEEIRAALDASGVADWAWDIRTNRVRWSPTLAELFGKPRGWSPEDGNTYLSMVHPDDQHAVVEGLQEAARSGKEYCAEHRVMREDGQQLWIEARGRMSYDAAGEPLSMAGLVVDVTERKVLQERLQRSERLDSLGRLAGGVAHDFNNLLTTISGAAELLALRHDSTDDADLIDLILSSSSRAAELTRQLLAFGHRQPNEAPATDLGALLVDMRPLLASMLGETVRLQTRVDGAAYVRGDSYQLQQVLMNLAINGRDAMPGGGLLQIVVERAPPYARLIVEDHGIGMAPQVVARIFEPYFSTKATSQGTGLGLAVCHGVVDQLDGTIDVDTEEGRGSRFVVTLPLSAPPARPTTEARDQPPQSTEPLRILLVEDDQLVADLLLRVLRSRGHRVVHAPSGPAALDALESGAPDILICDVVLPGLSGPEVVLEALGRHGDLPVLMMTGYAPDDLPADLADVPLLTKPFSPGELLRRIHELTLDG